MTTSNIIGFTNVYYTLWNVTNENIYFTDSAGNALLSNTRVRYDYIKNISMDIDKVKETYPDLIIDEGLRGKTSSWIDYDEDKDLCPHILKFGKYRGYDLNELVKTDFDYVLWLVENSSSANGRYAKELMEVKNHFENIENQELEQLDSRLLIIGEFLTENEITLTPNKNLSNIDFDYIGYIHQIGDIYVYFIFEDFKMMSYNGYDYALPIIDGKGKRFKNKEVKLHYSETIEELSDSHAIYVKVDKIEFL